MAYVVEGIMRSGGASVWHAARAMSEVNNQTFKTNEKRGNRLLQDNDFQVDDRKFRKYTKILFKTLFIKALRHLLPKKYEYTIVADRGFGNQRFAKLCEENGFDFVLRINENLKIEKKGKM